MIFGLLLKLVNNLHFKDKISLFFETIPQIVFFTVTFGYMVFCIIYKWLKVWGDEEPVSIIHIFIDLYEVKEGEELYTSANTQ